MSLPDKPSCGPEVQEPSGEVLTVDAGEVDLKDSSEPRDLTTQAASPAGDSSDPLGPEPTLVLGGAGLFGMPNPEFKLDDLDDFPDATVPLGDAWRPCEEEEEERAPDLPGHLPSIMIASTLPWTPAPPVPDPSGEARAASIAPLAMDVPARPDATVRMPVQPASPLPLPLMPLPPQADHGGQNTGLMVALAAAGIFALGILSAGASYALSSSSEAPEVAAAAAPTAASPAAPTAPAAVAPSAAPTAAPAPRVGQTVGAGLGRVELPASAPQKAETQTRHDEEPIPTTSVGALTTVPKSGSRSSQSVADTLMAASGSERGSSPRSASSPRGASPATPTPTSVYPAIEPEAPRAAPPPPPQARPVSTTGMVRVSPTLRAVLVDGSYKRVNNGEVVLACGLHRIQGGFGQARVVNVPCGGTVNY